MNDDSFFVRLIMFAINWNRILYIVMVTMRLASRKEHYCCECLTTSTLIIDSLLKANKLQTRFSADLPVSADEEFNFFKWTSSRCEPIPEMWADVGLISLWSVKTEIKFQGLPIVSSVLLLLLSYLEITLLLTDLLLASFRDSWPRLLIGTTTSTKKDTNVEVRFLPL